MDFQVSDWVIYCTHGLGQVVFIEERVIDDNRALYHEDQNCRLFHLCSCR